MLSVLGFLIILGPLVIVHEFGHYFFARLFNVKAEAFSVGFGPRIWAKKRGETEWRISAIPLGGYVKLLGEDREAELSPEDQKRALHRQAPWKRFFIFFGGPLFNFLFAILVFAAILMIGEPQMASVVGRVVKGSVAEKAGFQSGDRILSVGHKPVKRFEEVAMAIHGSPGQPIEFEIQRTSQPEPIRLSATPSGRAGFSLYGEYTQVGEIDGLLPTARSTRIGVSNPTSPAGEAGLQTGDEVLELNGKPVSSWEALEAQYQKEISESAKAGRPATEATLRLKVKKREGREPREVTLTHPAAAPASAQALGAAWGLYSSELFVEKVVPGSPAEKAGLKPYDRLVGVKARTDEASTREVQSFFELKDSIQQAGETTGKVFLQVEREGEPLQMEMIPTANESRDPALKKTVQYTVGVIPILVHAEPETYVERIWNPVVLLYQATDRMISFSWRNLVSVGKMIKGDVSVGTLGGPILIGKIAGESLSRGLIAFLTTMAILSIGLGVLNVLPVPVLDGGHLMLLGVEAVRGKPLTLRQMEIIQGVGLILILALMGVVIRNDLSRLSGF